MRVVVTGGHLTPAIATIIQLKKLNPKIRFYFFGRRRAIEGDKADSFEYLEIKNLSLPFFEIPSGRLQRRLTRYFFISLIKIFPGFLKSAILLLKIRPNIVLTFGGYLALPVAAAAFLLKIPVVAHEQSPKLGLANRIIFKLAKLKGVSEKKLAQELQNQSVIYTAPLFRQELFKPTPISENLVIFLKKVSDMNLIYITGGATGSHFLNQTIKSVLPQILKESFVIHQTGNLFGGSDFVKLSEFKKRLPKKLAEKYFVAEFIKSFDIGEVLQKVKIVICRSGANTTSELAALGKVGIIIPLEWGLEQKTIASKLGKLGAFLVIPQSKATPENLLAAITDIFKNYNKFAQNAKALAQKIEKNGAIIFAKEILKII